LAEGAGAERVEPVSLAAPEAEWGGGRTHQHDADARRGRDPRRQRRKRRIDPLERQRLGRVEEVDEGVRPRGDDAGCRRALVSSEASEHPRESRRDSSRSAGRTRARGGRARPPGRPDESRPDRCDTGGAPRGARPSQTSTSAYCSIRRLEVWRAHRAPGFFQRFVNYLERDSVVLEALARHESTTASVIAAAERLRLLPRHGRAADARADHARFPAAARDLRPRRASASCWCVRPPAHSASGAASERARTLGAGPSQASRPRASGRGHSRSHDDALRGRSVIYGIDAPQGDVVVRGRGRGSRGSVDGRAPHLPDPSLGRDGPHADHAPGPAYPHSRSIRRTRRETPHGRGATTSTAASTGRRRDLDPDRRRHRRARARLVGLQEVIRETGSPMPIRRRTGVEARDTELVMGETRAHAQGSTATSSPAAFPCSARVMRSELPHAASRAAACGSISTSTARRCTCSTATSASGCARPRAARLLGEFIRPSERLAGPRCSWVTSTSGDRGR